jgi:YgiT-type zinc finger domain-containing protein
MKSTNKNRLPCSFCDGELEDALVQHPYRWQGRIYVFEEVPTQVCKQCGEKYFDAKIVEAMEHAVLKKVKPTRTMRVPVFAFNRLAA